MKTPEEKELERALIISARRGSLADFEKILLRYERPIFAHIYRMVGSIEDTKDLTQETFIKLYENIGKADPDKGFSAWVYKIATNTVFDWLRRKRIRDEVPLYDENGESPFETIEVWSTYYSVEEAKDLETALERIKPVYKTALLLYYQKGFKYEEIAGIMSLPLNTVKTLIRRGKEALKNVLGENYGR